MEYFKKLWAFKTIAVCMMIFCIATLICVNIDKSYASSASKASPGFPHVKRVSDTSLQISWDKVPGASGYEVFRYSAAKGKYSRVKAINRGNATRWTDRRLATGKKYSYKVRAWSRVHDKAVKGTRQHSSFTYAVSAVPYRKDAAKVNAGAELKGPKSMTIGLMQKLDIKAVATPAKYGTAKKKTVVDKNIRVVVTNAPFVRKSGSKAITGRRVGRTNVYALAHNGNLSKIAVNVVDYAKPKAWYWRNIDPINQDVRNLFTTNYDDFTDMVSWLAQHNQRLGILSLDKSGDIVNIGMDQSGNKTSEIGTDISGRAELVKRVLGCFPQGDMKIFVQKKAILIAISMNSGVSYSILYSIQNEIVERPDDSIYGDGLKIAPHWVLWMFAPV